MANIIELLEGALTRTDWELVNEAYKTLTGKYFEGATPVKQEREVRAPEIAEVVSPRPVIILPSPEEVEEFTTSSEEEDDDDVEELEEEDDDIEEENNERMKCRRVPFDTSKKKNSWKDNRTMAVADIDIDKKLHANQEGKTIEKRPKAKKVKVNCDGCHKDYILPRHLAPVKLGESGRCRYVCDRCITRKRGHD